MHRAVLVLVLSVPLLAQAGSGTASFSNPKVRAITAFVRLDRADYGKQVVDALRVLRKAKTDFGSAGYEVETIRITTQPLAEVVPGLEGAGVVRDVFTKDKGKPDVAIRDLTAALRKHASVADAVGNKVAAETGWQ